LTVGKKTRRQETRIQDKNLSGFHSPLPFIFNP
jgi:hypothetical protein